MCKIIHTVLTKKNCFVLQKNVLIAVAKSTCETELKIEAEDNSISGSWPLSPQTAE